MSSFEVDGGSSGNAGPPSAYNSYKLLITSNSFFVFASLCYVVASILDYQENLKPVDEQGVVKLAYLLKIVGAISFIVVGGVDFYNTAKKLHILLILAGFFGTISAATSETNLQASLVCNLLSVHFYLLESLQWIYGHVFQTKLDKDDSRTKSLLLAEIGDFCFMLGAFMDVILSYYYFTKTDEPPEGPGILVSTQSVTTSQVEISSSVFWLIASMVAITVSCKTGKQGFEGVSQSTKLSSNIAGNLA